MPLILIFLCNCLWMCVNRYPTTDIVADVAYDMFSSSSADGSNEYETMIWLAALGGAGPICSTGSAIPTVTVNGVS